MIRNITKLTYLARRYSAMGDGLNVQVSRDGDDNTMTWRFGFGGGNLPHMLLTRDDLVKLAGLVNVVLDDWSI